jgi:hypothetical protein
MEKKAEVGAARDTMGAEVYIYIYNAVLMNT